MELDEAIRLYEMNYDSQLVIHGEFNIISLFKIWFRLEIYFPELISFIYFKNWVWNMFIYFYFHSFETLKLFEIVFILIYLL